MFDNELLHVYEFASSETCGKYFEGEALRHQSRDLFRNTVGISPGFATRLFLALKKVVARLQSKQKLQRRASAKRVFLKYFIDTSRTNAFSSRSKATPGCSYFYDCFEDRWDRKTITPIDKICNAASEDAMHVLLSLNKTSAIGNKPRSDRMTSWSGHCDTFLCSRSTATHRTEKDDK